jgi:hypothetical protein
MVKRHVVERAPTIVGQGGLSLASYPIAVVVPTTLGWPGVRMTLESILPQLRAHRGQLVVADSSDAPAPGLSAEADVLWLKQPRESVFRVRRAGYSAAQAELVAVTEDHCVVAEDWLDRIVAAHAAERRTAAVGGAVENGTQEHISDWALYLMGHVRWAPPLPREPGIVVGHSNISYKRWAIDRMPQDGIESIEIFFHRYLRRSGQRVIVDDRIRVKHHQCISLPELLRLQYNNGRAIAGLRRDQMRAADWLRLVLPLGLAAFRLVRTVSVASTKPLPRAAVLLSIPYLATSHVAHALGETVGYLRGQGSSAIQLH